MDGPRAVGGRRRSRGGTALRARRGRNATTEEATHRALLSRCLGLRSTRLVLVLALLLLLLLPLLLLLLPLRDASQLSEQPLRRGFPRWDDRGGSGGSRGGSRGPCRGGVGAGGGLPPLALWAVTAAALQRIDRLEKLEQISLHLHVDLSQRILPRRGGRGSSR